MAGLTNAIIEVNNNVCHNTAFTASGLFSRCYSDGGDDLPSILNVTKLLFSLLRSSKHCPPSGSLSWKKSHQTNSVFHHDSVAVWSCSLVLRLQWILWLKTWACRWQLKSRLLQLLDIGIILHDVMLDLTKPVQWLDRTLRSLTCRSWRLDE